MGQYLSRVQGGANPVDLTKLTATDWQRIKIGGIVGAVVGLAGFVRLQPDVTVDTGQLQCLGVPEAVCEQLVKNSCEIKRGDVAFDLPMSIKLPDCYFFGWVDYGESQGHFYVINGEVTDFNVGSARLLQVDMFAKSRVNPYPDKQPFLETTFRNGVGEAQKKDEVEWKNVRESKLGIAKEVVEALPNIVRMFFVDGANLSELKILDAGSGYGFNAKALQDAGATVFGVEPDEYSRQKAIEEGNQTEDQLYAGTLQEFEKSDLNTNDFDVLTVFLWNVPPVQYDDFMQAAGRCIREGGAVVIGVFDDAYFDRKALCCVLPAILRNFKNCGIVERPGEYNRVYYVCMEPKVP